MTALTVSWTTDIVSSPSEKTSRSKPVYDVAVEKSDQRRPSTSNNDRKKKVDKTNGLSVNENNHNMNRRGEMATKENNRHDNSSDRKKNSVKILATVSSSRPRARTATEPASAKIIKNKDADNTKYNTLPNEFRHEKENQRIKNGESGRQKAATTTRNINVQTAEESRPQAKPTKYREYASSTQESTLESRRITSREEQGKPTSSKVLISGQDQAISEALLSARESGQTLTENKKINAEKNNKTERVAVVKEDDSREKKIVAKAEQYQKKVASANDLLQNNNKNTDVLSPVKAPSQSFAANKATGLESVKNKDTVPYIKEKDMNGEKNTAEVQEQQRNPSPSTVLQATKEQKTSNIMLPSKETSQNLADSKKLNLASVKNNETTQFINREDLNDRKNTTNAQQQQRNSSQSKVLHATKDQKISNVMLPSKGSSQTFTQKNYGNARSKDVLSARKEDVTNNKNGMIKVEHQQVKTPVTNNASIQNNSLSTVNHAINSEQPVPRPVLLQTKDVKQRKKQHQERHEQAPSKSKSEESVVYEHINTKPVKAMWHRLSDLDASTRLNDNDKRKSWRNSISPRTSQDGSGGLTSPIEDFGEVFVSRDVLTSDDIHDKPKEQKMEKNDAVDGSSDGGRSAGNAWGVVLRHVATTAQEDNPLLETNENITQSRITHDYGVKSRPKKVRPSSMILMSSDSLTGSNEKSEQKKVINHNNVDKPKSMADNQSNNSNNQEAVTKAHASTAPYGSLRSVKTSRKSASLSNLLDNEFSTNKNGDKEEETQNSMAGFTSVRRLRESLEKKSQRNVGGGSLVNLRSPRSSWNEANQPADNVQRVPMAKEKQKTNEGTSTTADRRVDDVITRELKEKRTSESRTENFTKGEIVKSESYEKKTIQNNRGGFQRISRFDQDVNSDQRSKTAKTFDDEITDESRSTDASANGMAISTKKTTLPMTESATVAASSSTISPLNDQKVLTSVNTNGYSRQPQALIDHAKVGVNHDSSAPRGDSRRRIGSLVIQTGEARDKELRSAAKYGVQSKNVKAVQDEGASLHNGPRQVVAGTKLQQVVKDVTFDDGKSIKETSNRYGNDSFKHKENNPPKQTSIENKNEANRIEDRLIPPEMIYNAPIEQVKSILSVKNKSKKQRKATSEVSFSLYNLFTLHVYPSFESLLAEYPPEEAENVATLERDEEFEPFDSMIGATLGTYKPSTLKDINRQLEREREAQQELEIEETRKFGLKLAQKQDVNKNVNESTEHITYSDTGDYFSQSQADAGAMLF